MARAGRKRKQGPRSKGRLIKTMPIDRGTERTQAMQKLYGTDGCDAIGRAYRAGLLGEGSEAKTMLDLARAISNAYWCAYETGRYQCALGDRTFGNVTPIDHAKVKAREVWLRECLDVVDRMGAQTRRAFRQLVVDVNPDSGPKWLDAVIYAERMRVPARIEDRQALRAALDGLEILAS